MRRATATTLAAALAVSCGHGAPAWTSAGTSIAEAHDGTLVWLTSPDDDRVVAVDPASLVVMRTFDVAGGPSMFVELGDALLVTLERATDVAFVSVADGTVSRLAVPCGGTRGVAWDGDHTAYVACPSDDRVVVIDVRSRSVVRFVDVVGKPTAVAVADGVLAVTASRLGEVVRLSRQSLDDAPNVVTLETVEGHAASQVDALGFAADGALLASWQRVEHDGDRARPATEGGYGSIVDGNPRIEPRMLAPCGGRYAHFDGGVRAASGPSAIVLRSGVLWVAHLTTDSVLAFSCPSGATEPAAELAGGATEPVLLGAFRTGRGPRGLAVSADGRSAWVDVGFDHAVARLSLDAVTDPANATRPDLALARPLGTSIFSATALHGRNLFFDAVDTHLTPSGIVTCGTCHPAGGDDGLSWFLHTVGVNRKLRRTPVAWGARAALLPFHWDGEFTDAAVLSHTTIVELMNGDALLVDTSAIAAYMAEQPPPPPRPLDGAERASADRGSALFASAGCASCHTGALGTDLALHSVVAATADADATLGLVDTPSLVAVRSRAPYLHDGRAATLRDVLTTANPGDTHGVTSTLTAAQLDDLVQYLDSL